MKELTKKNVTVGDMDREFVYCKETIDSMLADGWAWDEPGFFFGQLACLVKNFQAGGEKLEALVFPFDDSDPVRIEWSICLGTKTIIDTASGSVEDAIKRINVIIAGRGV